MLIVIIDDPPRPGSCIYSCVMQALFINAHHQYVVIDRKMRQLTSAGVLLTIFLCLYNALYHSRLQLLLDHGHLLHLLLRDSFVEWGGTQSAVNLPHQRRERRFSVRGPSALETRVSPVTFSTPC